MTKVYLKHNPKIVGILHVPGRTYIIGLLKYEKRDAQYNDHNPFYEIKPKATVETSKKWNVQLSLLLNF